MTAHARHAAGVAATCRAPEARACAKCTPPRLPRPSCAVLPLPCTHTRTHAIRLPLILLLHSSVRSPAPQHCSVARSLPHKHCHPLGASLPLLHLLSSLAHTSPARPSTVAAAAVRFLAQAARGQAKSTRTKEAGCLWHTSMGAGVCICGPASWQVRVGACRRQGKARAVERGWGRRAGVVIWIPSEGEVREGGCSGRATLRLRPTTAAPLHEGRRAGPGCESAAAGLWVWCSGRARARVQALHTGQSMGRGASRAAPRAQARGPAARMFWASSGVTWPPPSSNFLKFCCVGWVGGGGRRRSGRSRT